MNETKSTLIQAMRQLKLSPKLEESLSNKSRNGLPTNVFALETPSTSQKLQNEEKDPAQPKTTTTVSQDDILYTGANAKADKWFANKSEWKISNVIYMSDVIYAE